MNFRLQIGNRWVGDGEPVFVIAEIGSNHDHDFDLARRLIDAATAAGADAVKFQLFSATALYPNGGELFSIIRDLELPREWVPALVEHARDRGLLFLASPFDRDAIDVLSDVGAPAYKIASSETTNLPLVAYAAAQKKPMLISTGMCDLADIHEAVEVSVASGATDVALLQCSALYPSLPNQAHLRVMDTLRQAFRLPVGFSDHSLGATVPTAAVARGACIIEKHFTLDRSSRGPDHSYAMEPGDFSLMVSALRETQASLGEPEKKLLREESIEARRESLRAKRDLEPGTVLTSDDIVAARPADGIRPRLARAIVGRRLREAVAKDQLIVWGALEP